MKSMYLNETSSTNLVLKAMIREYDLPEGFVLRTDFQSLGKGQQGNSWESQKRMNLLFSMLLYPHHIAIHEQFVLSQIVSIAIVRVFDGFVRGFNVKWPNDIYFGEKKIGGILIENSLQGSKINYCIVGLGLNINQTVFKSDAPNPVSLRQITGKSERRKLILAQIEKNILDIYKNSSVADIQKEYFSKLYRGEGFFEYRDENGNFEAAIHNIDADGCLQLKRKNGQISSYYFKEVEFVL